MEQESNRTLSPLPLLLDPPVGRIFWLWRWLYIGIGYLEKLRNINPWTFSRASWTNIWLSQFSQGWFCPEQGGRLNRTRGPFQPCSPIILWSYFIPCMFLCNLPRDTEKRYLYNHTWPWGKTKTQKTPLSLLTNTMSIHILIDCNGERNPPFSPSMEI